MAAPPLAQRLAEVRRFNRFYTRQIGVLQEGLLQSPFSLAEVRVLYEIAHRERPTASGVARLLRIDAGYLSRILARLRRRRLLVTTPVETDRRQRMLRLTARGRQVFGQLEARSTEQVRAMLAPLSPGEQGRLLRAMGTIENLLGEPPESDRPAYILRPPQPGDLGWVVQRHGALYAEEYGWDERFEGLVAGIVAAFAQQHDRKRERAWIAERNGENVGCIFIVRESDMVAKLRLLLVEPAARRLGLGSRLVDECIRFARRARYRTLRLWTNDVLHDARRLYERAGFRLVHSEPHQSFGPRLVGQTWELEL